MKRLAECKDLAAYHGGVWPNAAQQLLLRAALLDAPAATDAWGEWLASARIDALDSASWKLIPMVYGNLKRLGVAHPISAQARDCHVYSWSCNQRLFHHSAGFLEELRAEGVPALVLKGVALANLYYPDTGARAMADLDLLVPGEKFLELGKRLLRSGWKETDGHSFDAFDMAAMPSFGFMRQDGFCVDIHCHVLHADCARGADEEFWAHARPWKLRGQAALTLSREDHLLHVISHGVRWCDVPPFRWIADAWWILAWERDCFDWERFCRQVRAHEVSLPVLHGLRLMSEMSLLELRAGIMEQLELMPVSAGAEVRFIAATHPLPKAFFSRAWAIWKALGEKEPGYTIAGKKSASVPKKRRRNFPALMLFAIRVAIRDRTKIAEALRDAVVKLLRRASGRLK